MSNELANIVNEINTTKENSIVISPSNADQGSFIMVSDENVIASSRNSVCGIAVGKDGVLIQGDLHMTSKGTSIKKGEYSENPNSAKIFTYTETIDLEANAKEILAEAAGKLGVNTEDLTKDGIIPLMTSIGGSAGIAVPHVHTMMFEHTHRIEPQYLYRIPKAIT